MMRREAGFTLLELLVVLAVLALAGILSFPLLQRAQPHAAVDQAAGQIVSTLRRARERSLSNNTQARVTLDLGARQLSADGDETFVFAESIAIQTLSEGGLGFPQTAQFRFFPSGGSTGGTIDVASGSKVIRIKLNWITGAITQDAVEK